MGGVKGRSGGHNRKSLEELQLAGAVQKSRHGGLLGKGENQSTNDPNWSTAEEIRAGLVGYLEGNGSARAEDHIPIDQFVILYKAWREARDLFEAEGIQAKVGNKSVHNVMLELAKELRMLLGEFRLTLNTRAKVLSEPVKSELSVIMGGLK